MGRRPALRQDLASESALRPPAARAVDHVFPGNRLCSAAVGAPGAVAGRVVDVPDADLTAAAGAAVVGTPRCGADEVVATAEFAAVPFTHAE